MEMLLAAKKWFLRTLSSSAGCWAPALEHLPSGAAGTSFISEKGANSCSGTPAWGVARDIFS